MATAYPKFGGAYRSSSIEGDDPLYSGDSPRTPYAAVAYPQGRRWRDRPLLQLLLVLMLAAGLGLIVIGLAAPQANDGHGQMHLMQPAPGAHGAPGAPEWRPAPVPSRHVLVVDCGSSGSRM